MDINNYSDDYEMGKNNLIQSGYLGGSVVKNIMEWYVVDIGIDENSDI